MNTLTDYKKFFAALGCVVVACGPGDTESANTNGNTNNTNTNPTGGNPGGGGEVDITKLSLEEALDLVGKKCDVYEKQSSDALKQQITKVAQHIKALLEKRTPTLADYEEQAKLLQTIEKLDERLWTTNTITVALSDSGFHDKLSKLGICHKQEVQGKEKSVDEFNGRIIGENFDTNQSFEDNVKRLTVSFKTEENRKNIGHALIRELKIWVSVTEESILNEGVDPQLSPILQDLRAAQEAMAQKIAAAKQEESAASVGETQKVEENETKQAIAATKTALGLKDKEPGAYAIGTADNFKKHLKALQELSKKSQGDEYDFIIIWRLVRELEKSMWQEIKRLMDIPNDDSWKQYLPLWIKYGKGESLDG